MGGSFNIDIQPIIDSFPNLENLVFGHKFNKNVDIMRNAFPHLTHLSFGKIFEKNIDSLINSFPNLVSVKKNIIGKHSCQAQSMDEFINLMKNEQKCT